MNDIAVFFISFFVTIAVLIAPALWLFKFIVKRWIFKEKD